MTDEQRVLMTVRVSTMLHRSVKATAALQGKTLREAVTEALKEWLANNKLNVQAA